MPLQSLYIFKIIFYANKNNEKKKTINNQHIFSVLKTVLMKLTRPKTLSTIKLQTTKKENMNLN